MHYSVHNKGKLVGDYPNSICFRNVYGSLQSYDKIVYHAPKRNNGILNEEEIYTYLHAIASLGFYFELEETERMFNFTIPIDPTGVDGNTIPATKVLLNAVRYIEEPDMEYVIKQFLRMLPLEMGVSMFAKLILAHYTATIFGNINHTFINWNKYHVLITDKQFNELIISGTSNTAINNTIPCINCDAMPTHSLRVRFSAIFPRGVITDSALENITTYYNKLCKQEKSTSLDEVQDTLAGCKVC